MKKRTEGEIREILWPIFVTRVVSHIAYISSVDSKLDELRQLHASAKSAFAERCAE